jgi:hypothetical protein
MRYRWADRDFVFVANQLTAGRPRQTLALGWINAMTG